MIEMGKTAIPATLYVIQNNLAYLAISNLDAVCCKQYITHLFRFV
jgi:hypothetical protein